MGHRPRARSDLRACRRCVGVAAVLLLTACANADGSTTGTALDTPIEPPVTVAPVGMRPTFPPAPTPGHGPTPEADAAWDRLVADLALGGFTVNALDAIVEGGDARHAWLVADLLRFFQGAPESEALVEAFVAVTGVDPRLHPGFADREWSTTTDHLIAWDLPAPEAYPEQKAALLLLVEPAWAPFFDDPDAEVDWRWVAWGGVRIDDRPLGETDRCPRGCIPALDDPALVAADAGDWYPDDAIVFGIVEGDEAVALPRNVMEVHEMVNATIGGRRFGIPYCTLCGAAHAYRTDVVPDGVEVPVLRTSGLLSRSNKVMFDLVTWSLFDTFTGRAVSGPLRTAGVVLEPVTVVVTTWAEWRAEHPHTTIVAEDGGIGRDYPLDPLRGRDDSGPIFPVGDVDGRLAVQERVVGVITPDGRPVAFPAAAAREVLRRGGRVASGNVELVLDAGGLRAVIEPGVEIAAHEAFWFAWSQFHPDTDVWLP